VAKIPEILQEIQDGLLARARAHRAEHTVTIDDEKEFYDFFTAERDDPNAPPPLHGGFALTHFSGDVELEERIKNDLSVTVRCIPFEGPGHTIEPGTCPFTGKPSAQRVVWAKSY
jgi:prolyl-tRNA synthetase